MPITTGQQASLGEACSTLRPVRWPKQGLTENPRASYYRARYYDPNVGRFATEDPIGFQAGPDFYRYVNNNPTTLADPFGLQEDPNWFYRFANRFLGWLLDPPKPKPGTKPFGFGRGLFNLCNAGQTVIFTEGSPVNPYAGKDSNGRTDPKTDAAVSVWRKGLLDRCEKAQTGGNHTVLFCGGSALGPNGPTLVCSCCAECPKDGKK
jgi:RHS repeat-associated protein